MDILMSICDYIPVVVFLIGSIILQRDLYNKMSKGAFALFSGGTIFVFMAGVFKASQKILYYTNVCNFVPLKECFFPMQTTGFVLAAIGLFAMVVHPQGPYKQFCIAPLGTLSLVILAETKNLPAEWNGTILFVILMILGVFVMDGCLIYISIKNHSKIAIPILVISFICILGMGYLSNREGISDWVKEGVNIIGQGCYLIAIIILRKKGLANVDFRVQKPKKA